MMARNFTVDQLLDMRGLPVFDASGQRVGELRDIYYDDATGVPEWIEIEPGRALNGRHVVPVSALGDHDSGVQVPFERDAIARAPEVDRDEIAPDREDALYHAFGMERPEYTGQAAESDSASLENLDIPPGTRMAPGAPAQDVATPPGTSSELGTGAQRPMESIGAVDPIGPRGHRRLIKWRSMEERPAPPTGHPS